MRFALLAVSLALCTCSRPAPFMPPCLGPIPAKTNPVIVQGGRPVVIEFTFTTECEAPEGITASVLDPTSETVESTAAINPYIATVNAYIATVNFTPTKPGGYQVVARFLPNRGLAQTDVTVPRDRSAEPGVEVPSTFNSMFFPPPTVLTDAGMMLWGQTIFRLVDGRLEHVRGFESEVHSRGPYFWAHDTLQVTRYVVAPTADGGVALVANPATPLQQGAHAIAPAENDVVMFIDAGQNVALGTILPDAGWQLRSFPSRASVAVTWKHRVGDAVIRLVDFGREECVLDLTGNTGEQCSTPRPAYPNYVGGDLDGFWLTDELFTTLVYRGAGGITLERPIDGLLLNTHGPVPVLDLGSFEVVAEAENGAIGFESWGGQLMVATRRTVVTRTDAGTLLIRRR